MKKETMRYPCIWDTIGGIFRWLISGLPRVLAIWACGFLLTACATIGSWHQLFAPDERFKLVMKEEAVLDCETGLVWERVPSSEFVDWYAAVDHCYKCNVGGRGGWRLPTVEELASLMGGGLPIGPFTATATNYWTITTDTTPTTLAGGRAWIVNTPGNVVKGQAKSAANRLPWCVRGQHGHDGNNTIPSSP